MKFKPSGLKTLTIANLLLLGFLVFAIFFVMIFPPGFQKILYQFCMTGILISSFFCIDKKYRRMMKWFVVIAIIIQWTYILTGNIILNSITKSVSICLYMVIAIWLIKQVSSSKTVDRILILESVNGFLMLGMFYTIIVALIMLIDPAAYHFQTPIEGNAEMLTNFDEYLYYAFGAFTTITYGDIMPVSPVAKSLSMAMGFSGQMYVAIIIAMIVGKYAGEKQAD